MAEPFDASTGPVGLGSQPMPPGALRCWQVMTRLAIDNRADAIDYLSGADPAVRLSAAALAALLDAFPPLPTHHIPRRTNDDAR
jgi:hypothetical protein